MRSIALGLCPLVLSLSVPAQSVCPDGGPLHTQVVQACFPSDCSSLQSLGFTPASGATLEVPRFDGRLESLVQVDVVVNCRWAVEAVTDNHGLGCHELDWTAELAGLVEPIDNLPAVTGFGPLEVERHVPLARPGEVLLGPSDGHDDCDVVQGPEATDRCVAGADHVAPSFDRTWSEASISLSGDDVTPWIAIGPGTGSVIRVDLYAFGSSSGSFPLSGCTTIDHRASVSLEVTYTYCPPGFGEALCGCTAGPCGNRGGADAGCENSTGQGATLTGSGTTSLAAADLVLSASGLPANKPGLFFQGLGAAAGGAGAVLGDGLRCATGSVVRLEVVTSDGAGQTASSADLAARSGAGPGERRVYQLWYRDSSAGPCGSGSNTTNGLGLIWAP